MFRRKLAEKLLAAQNEAERKELLEGNIDKADGKLAYVIKDICLEAFSSEPSRTGETVKALNSLLDLNYQPEIKACHNWVSGVAEITGGNLKKAIEYLEESAKIFHDLKKEHDAARTQVAKLIPLALLGNYEEAFKTGKEAIGVFEKKRDDLAAGKMERNLGNIVARQGKEQEAEELYLSAIGRFQKIGAVKELTMSENSLANTYAEMNSFRKAEEFYRRALERAGKNDLRVTVAEIEASMGNLAVFRGKFDDGLRFLELSRRKYEELEMPHQNTVAELEIADIYLELNLPEEAFSIYERITEDLQKLNMQGEEARARANFGRASTLLRKNDLAKSELKRSAQLFLAEKNKAGAAQVKLNEAKLELDSKNFANALKIAEEARDLLRESGYIRHELMALWLIGEILRSLKKYKKAEEILSETFVEAFKQEQKNIAQRTKNSLGLLALQKGERAEAKRHFAESIDLIESLRDPLPAEEFRMAFLADKLFPFENLAKVYLEEGNLEKAFIFIERSRSRSLAENIYKKRKRDELTKDEKNSHLFEKLEKLREELNWFYSRQNRAGTEDVPEIEKLQKEAKKREKQIADVMRRIESLGGNEKKYFPNSEDKALSVPVLQKLLGEKDALVEFVSFGEKLSVFVITGETIEYVADLADEDEIISLLEGLRFQFGALRYGTKSLERFMPELKTRADSYLQKLYKKLLAPVKPFLKNRNLLIVPAGSLHYVPFPALKDGKKYLIEEKEVILSPGANVWQALSSKSGTVLKSAFLLGFSDGNIPLVDQEIESLKEVFEKTETYVGNEATFSNYKNRAEDFDVLHLACHGQFRPDNPLFSSLQLADGFVTVRDIVAQRLNAKLVTLSACETALNKVFAGGEILGLARGFLSAGASSLVLSLWTVNDEATALLMKDFYAHVKDGKNISTALRNAQYKFIENNSHPYFWSSFAIIGK